jgi:hypothetical protein
MEPLPEATFVVKVCEVVVDVVDVADVLLVAVEELVTVNVAEA